MLSSRDRLTSIIKPMLPAAWQGRIEGHTVKTIGTLSAPSVFIDYVAISHDGMPQGQLVDEFEVALVSELTDYAKAEDDLDPTARAFVRKIDASSDLAWSKAEKRSLADKYLSWIITVQLLTPTTEE